MITKRCATRSSGSLKDLREETCPRGARGLDPTGMDLDGLRREAKAGLNLAAWEVQPMGQIGTRNPRLGPSDEQGAVPFADELRF